MEIVIKETLVKKKKLLSMKMWYKIYTNETKNFGNMTPCS